MKYRAKRGSVGRPLVIKKLKRPEGTITIRYKKIREKRFAKDIINMINGGKKYDEIAKHLGLTKAEVITINQNQLLNVLVILLKNIMALFQTRWKNSYL